MAEELSKSEPQSEAVAERSKPAPQTEAADIPLLRIDAVVKKFGAFLAVDRLSLDIRAGEFFALLGPSGCGKTTLLRMLAGFETPDQGRILVDGKDIAQVPPHQRPVNMMFQNYALFPHLTVWDNVAFGLKRAGMNRTGIDRRVTALVALLKLQGLERRRPDQLSGGQKQRVGVARALAADPPVMLMDEPFGAIDPITRARLQDEFLRILRGLHKTVVFVTHDIDEAIKMGDRIAILRYGALVQYGTPEAILAGPADPFVESFVGTDRALKRLGLIMAEAALEVAGLPAPSLAIPAHANLRDALSRMLEGGVDSLAVTGVNGVVLGVLTMSAIRRHTGAGDSANNQ